MELTLFPYTPSKLLIQFSPGLKHFTSKFIKPNILAGTGGWLEIKFICGHGGIIIFALLEPARCAGFFDRNSMNPRTL
jgi:hypothetical protein